MVNAQTLRAYVREKEESEEEMPEGLQPYIDVTEVYRLRVSPNPPKDGLGDSP